MSAADLITCGRLDVADAYRRLADLSLLAAVRISDPDSVPGSEASDDLAVQDCLVTIRERRERLAGARRGAARGRRTSTA